MDGVLLWRNDGDGIRIGPNPPPLRGYSEQVFRTFRGHHRRDKFRRWRTLGRRGRFLLRSTALASRTEVPPDPLDRRGDSFVCRPGLSAGGTRKTSPISKAGALGSW